MRTRILLLLSLLSLLFNALFIFIEPLSYSSLRRIKTHPSFITTEEIREAANNWRVGQVDFIEIEELKGVKFSPPLLLIAKSKGGDKIHLICALLNEYWFLTGEVPARNVPYILTLYQDGCYIYQYAEGREDSPPSGWVQNPWTGEAEKYRPLPPFLPKLKSWGIDYTRDTVQADDGRVGKHWIEGENYNPKTGEDGYLIDYEAINIDYEKLEESLKKEEQRLREVLGYKYELLMIAFKLCSESYRLWSEEGERKVLESRLYELFTQYQREVWDKILAERGKK
ncbi:MAG: hypothetical protein NC818_00205 [Candidatus Omnitrophica bacterium]|nr:hypothetical protein [Candidatus Omnitrophota bacterium]